MDFLDGLSDDALKKEATTEARSDTFSSIMKVMRGREGQERERVVTSWVCSSTSWVCNIVPVGCAVSLSLFWTTDIEITCIHWSISVFFNYNDRP